MQEKNPVDSFQFACKNFNGNAENAALAQTMRFESNKEYNEIMDDCLELPATVETACRTVARKVSELEGQGKQSGIPQNSWIRLWE